MSEKVIGGTVYVVGDNIDTDQIIPAQYLNLVPTIPDEYEKLGSYAMAGLPDECPPFVEPGKMRSAARIMVAGRNFGCGSSREHAPIALGAAGIEAVVAESYARIFFRNSIATGEVFPCESKERLCDLFATGDEAKVDIAAASITHCGTGQVFKLLGLGVIEKDIIEAGGIFGYAKKSGMM